MEAGPELHVIEVRGGLLTPAADLERMIHLYRSRADAFVFLSGGASNMSESARGQLLGLFSTFELLSRRGLRFAVGDGGTKAGIMAAAGLARRASGDAFLLLGVAPSPQIRPPGEPGKTAIEPHHSHVVAVHNDGWVDARRKEGWDPSQGYWGSETSAMYEIFGRLAEGRPSVAIVANGGNVTLDEVRQNIEQGREVIVIAGSGRAADAIASLLEGGAPVDQEVVRFREKAGEVGVLENRRLFTVLPLEKGAPALADLLFSKLSRPART